MTFPNQQRHNPWTDERLELLRKLRSEGFSFGYISSQIGLSRCACIGKAHRIDLPRRQEKHWYQTQTSGTTGLRTDKRKFTKRVRRKTILTPGLTDLEPEIAVDPISILDENLKLHHCRWPVDGHGLSLMFCGRQVICERSYCIKHFNMAYQKAPKPMDRGQKEALMRRMRSVRNGKAKAA